MGDFVLDGFHATDGFIVKRVGSGSVRIRKYKDSKCDNLIMEITFTASIWASIVSSVSARGETTESYHEAKALHDQKPKKDSD